MHGGESLRALDLARPFRCGVLLRKVEPVMRPAAFLAPQAAATIISATSAESLVAASG